MTNLHIVRTQVSEFKFEVDPDQPLGAYLEDARGLVEFLGRLHWTELGEQVRGELLSYRDMSYRQVFVATLSISECDEFPIYFIRARTRGLAGTSGVAGVIFDMNSVLQANSSVASVLPASTLNDQPNPLHTMWSQPQLEAYRLYVDADSSHFSLICTFVVDPSYPPSAYVSEVAEFVMFLSSITTWNPMELAHVSGIPRDRQWQTTISGDLRSARALIDGVYRMLPYNSQYPIGQPTQLSRGLIAAEAESESTSSQSARALRSFAPVSGSGTTFTVNLLPDGTEVEPHSLRGWPTPSSTSPIAVVEDRPVVDASVVSEHEYRIRANPVSGGNIIGRIVIDPSIPSQSYLPEVAALRDWLWEQNWTMERCNVSARQVYDTWLPDRREYERIYRAAVNAVPRAPWDDGSNIFLMSRGLRPGVPGSIDYFSGRELISGDELEAHLRRVGRLPSRQRAAGEHGIIDTNRYRFVLDIPHSDSQRGQQVYRVIRPGEQAPPDVVDLNTTPRTQAAEPEPAPLTVDWHVLDVRNPVPSTVLRFAAHLRSFPEADIENTVATAAEVSLENLHAALTSVLVAYRVFRAFLTTEPATTEIRTIMRNMWSVLQLLRYYDRFHKFPNLSNPIYGRVFRAMWSKRGTVAQLHLPPYLGVSRRDIIAEWLQAEHEAMERHYAQSDRCFWAANSLQVEPSKLELKERNTPRPRQILALEDHAGG